MSRSSGANLGAVAIAAMMLMLVTSSCRAGEDAGNTGVASGTGKQKTGKSESSDKEAVKVKEHKSGDWDCGLTDQEKQTLLSIARDTLKWCAEGSRKPFPMDSYEITPKLKEKLATFVTLKINGDLRGCIGSLAPVERLFKSVHDNTIQAAMHDFRFSRVRPEEVDLIHIDVSLLSPIREIPSLDDFKLGQDGIILSKSGHRSVFLPEVAVEQGWDKEETLSYLSRKAGMAADAWKEGAGFQVFQSVVLSE